MNTKLHAVTDAEGRPIRLYKNAGQVRYYKGAAALLDSLPSPERLLADRGYNADWFKDALKDKGIKPCIPGQKSRGKPIKHDKRRNNCGNRIEIMFGRLKDWRRVATHNNQYPKVSLHRHARSNHHVLAMKQARVLTLIDAWGWGNGDWFAFV